MTLPTLPDTGFDRLVTDRLVIRRFQAEDAQSLAAYRSDPDVARYQSWDTPFTLEQAQRFVSAMTDDHPDTPGGWFQFAVADAATGEHVGDVAAHTDEDEPRQARIGVTFAPAVQGRGYATEAVTALLDYLLLERGKHRVVADCDARNVASAALLERVGMRREAHHLRSVWAKGEWTDEFVFAVLADDWRAGADDR